MAKIAVGINGRLDSKVMVEIPDVRGLSGHVQDFMRKTGHHWEDPEQLQEFLSIRSGSEMKEFLEKCGLAENFAPDPTHLSLFSVVPIMMTAQA